MEKFLKKPCADEKIPNKTFVVFLKRSDAYYGVMGFIQIIRP